MKYNRLSAFMLFALSCMPVAAQKRAFTVEDVYSVKTAYGPAVSTQGKMVYTLSQSKQTSSTNIYDEEGGALTTDGKSYSPQWTQDGNYLYYTSSKSGLPQVYRLELNGNQKAQSSRFKARSKSRL